MNQPFFQPRSLKHKNFKKLTLNSKAGGEYGDKAQETLRGQDVKDRKLKTFKEENPLGSGGGEVLLENVREKGESLEGVRGGRDGNGLYNGDVNVAQPLHMKRLKKPLNLKLEHMRVKSKVVIAQPSPTNSDHSSNSITSLTPENNRNNGNDDSIAGKFSRLSVFQDNNDIQLEDLVQLGKIGAGNSGTVVKTLHVPDSRIIAKKSIPVENSELVKNQLIRELTIMKNVKEQANIVGFYGAYYTCMTNNEIIILMEYMDCGSLDKISSTYKRYCSRNNEPINYRTSWFTDLSLSKISFAVLNGLSYLYQDYKIIHRDIKPSNVLINSKGAVKICDFGVSKKMIDSIADTFVGTSTYMSPERIQGSCYSTKGDVWSLGLMIIELVTGEFPLGGHNDTPEGILDLLQRIVNESPPSLPAHGDFSPDIVDFVNCCCVKDERKRASLQQLMQHRYITKYNASDEYQRTFRHWCKRIKKRIKEDKMIQREEIERAKLVNRQLERSAQAAAAARSVVK